MTISRRTFARPTDVYRLFDQDGRLLYVGIAVNGYSRLDVHRREKAWWTDVRRVTVTRYENRRAALYVEACAIRDECPLHNQARNDITTRLPDRVRSLAVLEHDEFVIA